MANSFLSTLWDNYNCFFFLGLPNRTSNFVAEQSCKLYAPPINGSLNCVIWGNDPFCSVACRKGTDFVFNPPTNYFCSGGVWQFYAIPGQPFERRLPWPDCSCK